MAEYPLNDEGDKAYDASLKLYAVQLFLGITLLVISLCILNRKPLTKVSYIPWLLTASLASEITIELALPESLRLATGIVLFPELFASLIASGCHLIVTSLCFALASFYALYSYKCSHDLDITLFDVNSTPFYPVTFTLLISVAEGIRRGHINLVEKNLSLK